MSPAEFASFVPADCRERFLSLLRVSPQCWVFGRPDAIPGRYRSFSFSGRLHPAHRIAYTWVKGPVSDELVIDHLCRNPSCVRPDHLEAVTERENILRGECPTARRHRQLASYRRASLRQASGDVVGGVHFLVWMETTISGLRRIRIGAATGGPKPDVIHQFSTRDAARAQLAFEALCRASDPVGLADCWQRPWNYSLGFGKTDMDYWPRNLTGAAEGGWPPPEWCARPALLTTWVAGIGSKKQRVCVGVRCGTDLPYVLRELHSGDASTAWDVLDLLRASHDPVRIADSLRERFHSNRVLGELYLDYPLSSPPQRARRVRSGRKRIGSEVAVGASRVKPYKGATVLYREDGGEYVAHVTNVRGGLHDTVDLVVFNVGSKPLPDLNTNGSRERVCQRDAVVFGELCPEARALWLWPDVQPAVWGA